MPGSPLLLFSVGDSSNVKVVLLGSVWRNMLSSSILPFGGFVAFYAISQSTFVSGQFIA